MKKLTAFLLMAIISLALLAGCGNPVYDEFENFLNVEMSEVNANYEKIKAEAANWGEYEELSDLEASISDTLLPIVEDSLEKLENINPETDEVKAIKAKYVKAMEAYKEGFTLVLESIQQNDQEKMNAGNEKIQEGITLLGEYNEALQKAAAEAGAEIEF